MNRFRCATGSPSSATSALALGMSHEKMHCFGEDSVPVARRTIASWNLSSFRYFVDTSEGLLSGNEMLLTTGR